MRRLFHTALVLLSILLASCSAGKVFTPSASSIPTNPAASTASPTPVNTTTPIPTIPPTPTNSPTPIIPPTPTFTSTPLPVGLSRQNPYPRTELVSAPNMEVRVLDFKRGQDALNLLQTVYGKYYPLAPAGMEYGLVRLHVKLTAPGQKGLYISEADFSITGDRSIKYSSGSNFGAVGPNPKLIKKLSTGEEVEGWIGSLVFAGENNLMLVVNDNINYENTALRYIALDDGASVGVSPDLANIKPTSLGLTKDDPAPRTTGIITQDWNISVIDVVRGDEAWTMIREVNQYNNPPDEGMDYIAVKIRARYIGTEDYGTYISNNSFGIIGINYELNRQPQVVPPEPELEYWLYPGGEIEGWAVYQVAKGETGIRLVFNPDSRFEKIDSSCMLVISWVKDLNDPDLQLISPHLRFFSLE